MRVYISRDANVAEPFSSAMNKHKLEVLAFAQIEILPVEFEIKEDVDWIFFSSSNAALTFFKSTPVNHNHKYAAIGSATAAAVPVPCQFIGDTTHTKEVALAFKEVVGNRTVLFPIGDRSVRTIQSVFEPEQIVELTIYQTVEQPKVIPPCAAYVFSSPSNVYAAMKLTALQDLFCFSFGKSTTQSLVACGVQKIVELNSLEAEDMAAQIAKELHG